MSSDLFYKYLFEFDHPKQVNSAQTVTWEEACKQQKEWLNSLSANEKSAYEAARFVTMVCNNLNSSHETGYFFPFVDYDNANLVSLVCNELSKRFEFKKVMIDGCQNWKISIKK